MMSVL